MTCAEVVRVVGALAEARPLPGAALYELVRVGERGLLGEVVRVTGDVATIQVYEDTTGLRLGEPVEATGRPLMIELGPGLLGAVIDGVGRPLASIAGAMGDFIAPGARAPTLDPSRRWSFEPHLAVGARVAAGDVLGVVQETPGVAHHVLVPPGCAGVLAEVRAGALTVAEPCALLEDGTALRLAHAWPVRTPRPSARRIPPGRPFVTGQRVLDLLFPVAEGGSVAVPGGFGTGKTIVEQSLAKYADADVVVYIGCGERGNEMAEVLAEFPRLVDPRTGRSIMERTVLVVNTSNMPVAAREASLYVGVTIAEFYRDMGYRVALMADSTSRWAEALREVGSRLQEMPGEEGYPTYLGNRLGKLFERAGRVEALGAPRRTGALTIVSAISPPGGDLSEPVTQAALRVAGALWALDPALAHQRHFPAIDWETSYSLYDEATAPWFAAEVAADWAEVRRELMTLLQQERELREIASLVGPDALQDRERLLLECARALRELVLAQSAFDPNDASSSPAKTYRLARLGRDMYREGAEALRRGVPYERLELGAARRALAAARDAADPGTGAVAATVAGAGAAPAAVGASAGGNGARAAERPTGKGVPHAGA
ncbi:MAG: V-type ATP synthase subunit A [Gemmatimonadetes bacterium]|nr:V-type ATP synthase subunit A [Gemmatimonadota bacterium]